MSSHPKVLIASHPTRGVDVGAQAAIWDHLRTARAAGLAVLLISADLDELIGMSDTLKVILRGRLVGQADPHTVTPEELGAAMTGAGGRGGRRMTTTTSLDKPASGHGLSAATKYRLNRVLLNVVAAVIAALFAGAITSLILLIRGDSPTFVISQMWDYGTTATTELTIVNGATVYYLSAVAVAIGFRMNLFNIGVDGQYRMAAHGGRRVRRVGGAAGRAAADRHDHRRDDRRGRLGRYRGAAEGDPWGQRGHLDDHAELHRHQPDRLPHAPEHSRPQGAGRTSPPNRSRSPARSAASTSSRTPAARCTG